MGRDACALAASVKGEKGGPVLRFSSAGLRELCHLTQQAKPFISEQDYILLSSITNSVRPDGNVSEADYARLISIAENYTRERGLATQPQPLNVPSDGAAAPALAQDSEEISYICLLNLRYFLLSYSGIDHFPQESQGLELLLEQ